MQAEFLDEVAHAQKCGKAQGIVSVCSAHPYVLQAAMRRAAQAGKPVVVEATCNQVNQFGGYTGMVPAEFVSYIHRIARQNGLSPDQVLLGGDHLGPSVWQCESEDSAMQKATEMVQAYVQAGFVKIHLDASMRLGDDNPTQPLDMELSAQRVARLAKTAEQAYTNLAPAFAPRYIIGSEVPIPGGSQEHEEMVPVTKVEAVRDTIEATRTAFLKQGLEESWQRVRAVVVQPGIEFGNDFVLEYHPGSTQELVEFIEEEPRLVYEAHSTDYQTRQSLRQLICDHFAILKVGPALTFAFREAVFALAMMENELLPPAQRSNLTETLDEVMLRNPGHWQKYYRSSPDQQAFDRKYSFSDRARYYWSEPQIQAAFEKLMVNLSQQHLPLSLLSQYTPVQYTRIREKEIANTAQEVILDHIEDVLQNYVSVCET